MKVIFKDDIGKVENLPNVRGGRLQEILEELFGIGGSAADELESNDKSFSKYTAAGGSDKWPGLPADKLDYLHPSKDPLTNILSSPFGIKGADAGGGDGSQVASAAQTSPFPSDPASDASSSLCAKDGDEIAFGIFSKGEDGKLKINSADIQQYNLYKNI